MKYTFCLCHGRHEFPKNPPAIFPETVNPVDVDGLYKMADNAIPDDAEELDLYVTGLTVATLAVATVCLDRGITLKALHFNVENHSYYAQDVCAFTKCRFCGAPTPSYARVCPHCGG